MGWKGKYGDAGGESEQRRISGRNGLEPSPEDYRDVCRHSHLLARNARGDEEGHLAEPRRRDLDDRRGSVDCGVLRHLSVLRRARRGTGSWLFVEEIWRVGHRGPDSDE